MQEGEYVSTGGTIRRADRTKEHRTAFDKNKKRILATQDYCYLCGKLVDKTLKRPDPYAPEVDHIIPIAKGGHPSAIDNLALVHGICNKRKGDNLIAPHEKKEGLVVEPLGWSFNWVEAFKIKRG